MQTFLPYSNFSNSAAVLDYKRLGKQRSECKQLLNVLMGIGKVNKNGNIAWSKHPACLMWKGYEKALCYYGIAVCLEWRARGYKDSCLDFFIEAYQILSGDLKIPEFIGNEDFHLSHRSNLMRKDSNFYSKYFGNISGELPYIWPSRI
jgi:hypothetical protein